MAVINEMQFQLVRLLDMMALKHFDDCDKLHVAKIY